MRDYELLQDGIERGVYHTEHWELGDIKNATAATNSVVSFDTAKTNDSSAEGMSHRTLRVYEHCLSRQEVTEHGVSHTEHWELGDIKNATKTINQAKTNTSAEGMSHSTLKVHEPWPSSTRHVGSAFYKYEHETLRKPSCIEKVQYCRFRRKHSVLLVRRKNLTFQERLSNFVRRSFSGALLPWHLKNWCKVFMQMGNGVPWWRSFAMLLFYVIMLTSSLSSADYYSDYVSLYMKIFSKSACDGDYLRIDCPEGTSIDVKSAMYGRKLPSTEMCPSSGWMEGSGNGKSGIHEDTDCEAKTGAECQDQRICRLLVHRRVFGRDPCPGTSKYLTVRYQCAPKDFHRQSECVGNRMLLRCRQDTVISVFKVTPRHDNNCKAKMNATDCIMTKFDVFDDVSAKCHSKDKCAYTLPTASCFNRVRIIHTCVPKEFVTSELPISERLYTTTTTTTSTTTTTTTTAETTTEYSTTQEATSAAVQSTVNTDLKQKGDSTTISTSTSVVFLYEATTSKNHLSGTQGNLTATTTQGQAVRNTSFQLSIDVTNTSKRDNDIIINNEFPLIPDQSMGNEANVTQCVNCTDVNTANASGFYNMMMRLYTFFKENSDDFLIAVLLGVVVALLLTICVLVFRCKKKETTKERQKTEENRRPDNRQNEEEERDIVLETEAPVEEDEHENMSLLGSILQRSVDSNHVTPRSKVKSEPEEEEKDTCGPKSIFGKICCNCCCSNAPWQRTQILKRHRGRRYNVKHRVSSSLDDEEETSRSRSHETFPVFSRTEDNVDNRSPIPVLEDHVNRMEYPIVTSESVTSHPLTSQSQHQTSNFRPISRNAQRQYSVTPEPDSQYRTQQSTFQVRHENQRSDPALNRYSVRQHHSVSQPLTAPTSPVVKHHSNHMHVNGTQKLGRAYPVSNPKTLPVMGQSMLQTPHPAQTHQSPITPKYTPPPSQYYSTQQYPSFTEAYEQYDNAQQHNQMVVRRKQYPQRPQEYPGQSQYNHPHYGTPLSGYQPQNSYAGDHFVQAVARRTIPSNARTVDLAANARTVDLSHDNSVSRNSWLEIRRSSIYDNSLPRNNELFEFYQHQLHQQEMQHALHHELPGSRNLNHYYP